MKKEYSWSKEFDQSVEKSIDTQQLIGYIASTVSIVLGFYLVFNSYNLLAFLMFLNGCTITMISFFSFPTYMKATDSLKKIKPLMIVEDDGLSHGRFFISWRDITMIEYHKSKNKERIYTTITTKAYAPASFSHYSAFTSTKNYFMYLTIFDNTFTEDGFQEEVLRIAKEKGIKVKYKRHFGVGKFQVPVLDPTAKNWIMS